MLTASKKLEAAIAAYLTAGNFEISTFTAAPATNILTTASPHGLSIGDRLRLTNIGGALPAPLSTGTNVFVISTPTPTTLTLSATSGGSVIDITTAGTGTHTAHLRPSLVDGSDGWVIYESHSSGQRKARFHVVVEAGPESGGLVYAGMYDSAVRLTVYRLCQPQHGEAMTPIQFLNSAVELLAWAFSRQPGNDRNAIVKAALEAIDPTLSVTGFWPEDRLDEGVDEAFVTTLPLSFHIANSL